MPKVLVLYPDAEELPTLATKVNGLNKKSGPFDVVMLIGDCVPENEEKIRETSFDIPVYFASGASKPAYLTDGPNDHTTNLSYMGDFSTLSTPEGITILFVTGDEMFLQEKLEDITKSIEGKTIDILITYQWPNVLAAEKELFIGNTNVDALISKAQPKYHFAVGSSAGKFYERAPFQWEDSLTITRFISLGKYGSGDKWIYAFNLNKDPQDTPSNLTSNPFTEALKESLKRKRETEVAETQHKQTKRVVLPENCFFCLSNPNLESHMIVSIGEHAYLTIAKGPLTRPTSAMKFSGHCIIIPISHLPCLSPDDEHESVVTLPLYNEILRFQSSLVKFFNNYNLSTVFFQINKGDAVHFHIQCFPVAEDFLADFEKLLNKTTDINNTKYTRSAPLDFKKFESSEDKEYVELQNSKTDYISFVVFHGSVSKQEVFVSKISPEKSLDLQFGRRVMAYLLQTPKRLKWDKCQQGKAVEEHETETFKEAFKEFDFTLDL